MSTQTTPEFSSQDKELNEELQEIDYANRGCCFWLPCFGPRQSGDTVWERISRTEKEETSWWSEGLIALKKVREWSELVAGPKWKTFIRRFNKNRCRAGKFQYDPLSYALNFDEGPGQNGQLEDDRLFRDFSSRYAAVPGSAKSSMDLGKDAPSFA